MRRLVFTLLLFLSCGSTQIKLCCQTAIPVDSLYWLIRNRDVHRVGANWGSIDQGFGNKLNAATMPLDTIEAFVYILERLGDVHTMITYKGQTYGHYPTFPDSILARLIPMVKASNAETGNITAKVLQQHFGYLRIPGINAWGEEVNSAARRIRDALCQIASDSIRGYILDLRLNGGGQLSSMATGLAPLLGNTYLGGGVDISGNEENRFDIKDFNFEINGHPMTTSGEGCGFDLHAKPVVILLGPVTRSSGSILAILFRQRPGTYFIGDYTADGYTTGNDYFSFGPDLQINLSTLYHQDRGGHIYRRRVGPDVFVYGPDQFEQPDSDQRVIMAISWISGQAGN